ncbi:divergent polysaccharide deacetylase family protein [Oceanibaculum sp.]|uniref:divergent polysaccharide deacetylase family protein n=1 Tax=Oceanibaculum sp. TaxID=1903597 RepID=UPI00258DEBE5|nr:divergent polysaccharide deacetylase family protein [Oceanibaculum sp.]MCH2395991.1 divergent polysaccharide deacetylase family protein [Oceanibaculum sp.]
MARKPASKKPKTKKRSGGGGFGLSLALAAAALLIGGGLGLYYGDALTGRQAVVTESLAIAAPSPTAPSTSASAGITLPQTAAPLQPAPAPEAIQPAVPQPTEPQIASLPPQEIIPEPSASNPPWRRNAVPVPDSAGSPRIAIVIDDMGIDRKRSQRALALKVPVTFAYLPYAPGVADQVRKAHAAGHEILVHLPMEPSSDSIDPGPNAMLSGLAPEVLAERLAWNLSQFDGFVGVNNHMGSRFTSNAAVMQPVLEELRRRGLLFLDSRTAPNTVGYRMARDLGMPALQRDVFLDNTDSHDEVAKRLAETEQHASKYGQAIAIGHPRDATLDMLELWIEDVQARGFVLVPLTALLKPVAPPATAGLPIR